MEFEFLHSLQALQMHANTHITQNFSSLAIESLRPNKCNICEDGESSSACHNREEVGWAPEPVQMPCRSKKSMPKKIKCCFMVMK